MFNNTTKATSQIKFFRRNVTLFRIVYESIYGGCAQLFQRKQRHLHVHCADHFITIISTYLVHSHHKFEIAFASERNKKQSRNESDFLLRNSYKNTFSFVVRALGLRHVARIIITIIHVA